MGIRAHSLKFIHSIIDDLGAPLEILDMGNTYIKGDAIDYIKQTYVLENFTFIGDYITSKDYFTALGHNHTSIDLNEKEGSLPIDLRLPIIDDDKLVNNFDVILDIGTSEHVDNQYMNFKNLYELCKVGGLFIHVLPMKDYHENHCKYKYTPEFFNELATANGYELVILKNVMFNDQIEINCCLKKGSKSGFMSEDGFINLPFIIEDGHDFNDRELYPYAYSEDL